MKKEKVLKKNITYHDFKKRVFKDSFYTVLFVIIMLMFSLIFQDSISGLSIITIDFFQKICYFFIAITVFLLLIVLLNRTNISDENFKWYHLFFVVIDLFEFAEKFICFIFVVVMFFITPTTVSGESMMNTYYNNDKLLVWDFLYTPSDDVVVICDINVDDYDVDEDEYYIKRLVAVEGDTISYVADDEDDNSGDLYVNDELICEDITYNEFVTLASDKKASISYLSSEYYCTVPDGYSIVLGDNRNYSHDSRAIGMIHDSDIVGKVFFRYYSEYGNIGIVSKNLA